MFLFLFLFLVADSATAASLLTAARAVTPVRPCRDASRSSVFWKRRAIELRDKGFTVIPDAGITVAQIAEANAALAAEFNQLHGMPEELGLCPTDDSYAFAEIDKRHRLRWSLQPQGQSASSPNWSTLNALVEAAFPTGAAVIEELHKLPPHPDDDGGFTSWTRHLLPSQPEVGHVGAILSRPGARAQRFHADAGDRLLQLARLSPRHRLYNMFIPLVDLEEGGDGTMMWPRSHLDKTRRRAYYDAIDRSGCLEDDALVMSQSSADVSRSSPSHSESSPATLSSRYEMVINW